MPGRDIPRFLIAPPLRCYHSGASSRLALCGAIARWMRPGSSYFANAYFCDQHRSPSDVELPNVLVFRRVRVLCGIDFAGASWLPAISQAEALERLLAAVEDAGGLLNVHHVLSVVGEYRPSAPLGSEIGLGNGR